MCGKKHFIINSRYNRTRREGEYKVVARTHSHMPNNFYMELLLLFMKAISHH